MILYHFYSKFNVKFLLEFWAFTDASLGEITPESQREVAKAPKEQKPLVRNISSRE